MNLNNLVVGEELMDECINYSRPLKEYPTIQDICNFIRLNNKTVNISTKSLNKKGKAVQDKMEDYLSSDYISSGMLKEALKTPLHFKFSLDGDKAELQKLQGEKKHFILGEFSHQAILEPSKFSKVLVEPKYSLASHDGVNKGIEFWEDILLKKNKDFQIFINKEHSSLDEKKTYLKNIIELTQINPVDEESYFKIKILEKHYNKYGGGILNRLLKNSKREISFYYNDLKSGLKLKVRPDALQFKENIGVDAVISIKSSASEDLTSFFNQAAKLHYDLSEGMYQEIISKVTGRDFNTTIMVFLQTVAPFAVAVLVWSPEDIETGKNKFYAALQTAKESIENDVFLGYDYFSEKDNFGLIQMNLPSWNNRNFLPTDIEN